LYILLCTWKYNVYYLFCICVVQNIGQVVLPDSGRSITMTKGACLFLDRADCTDFLRQGLVQLYDGEEVDF